ncbi:hypothetical protein QTO34_012688 [Cnephaeus nilssonii]|uniref:Uncharacterized protein n=1 Tax=Cnephaeus nilssonii TaxID=3371016 RepID=A0AA40LCN2_CNENI|nr:hypothetical protein QTO34_012688 [Eptesicus nilssonii]
MLAVTPARGLRAAVTGTKCGAAVHPRLKGNGCARDVNGLFTKEDAQMAHTHMKSSQPHQEVQIKTAGRGFTVPVNLLKIPGRTRRPGEPAQQLEPPPLRAGLRHGGPSPAWPRAPSARAAQLTWSLCNAINVYSLTCSNCPENCADVLFSNKITFLMDLLTHQLTRRLSGSIFPCPLRFLRPCARTVIWRRAALWGRGSPGEALMMGNSTLSPLGKPAAAPGSQSQHPRTAVDVTTGPETCAGAASLRMGTQSSAGRLEEGLQGTVSDNVVSTQTSCSCRNMAKKLSHA